MAEQAKECQMCHGPLGEFGQSPWCNYCGKLMCEACERQHNKEHCRVEQEFKKGT